jgi:hypothetical protein
MIKYEIRRLTNGYPEFCGEFHTKEEAEAKVESLRAGCRDVFIVSPRFIPEHGAFVYLLNILSKTARA